MSLKGHTREIVLGVTLVMVAVWLLRPAAPEPGDDAEAQARAVRAEVTVVKAKYEEIDIAALAKKQSDYDGGGRNLFDYGVIQPPPPSPEELEARRKAEEERRRLAELARLEAERLRREELIGRFLKVDGKPRDGVDVRLVRVVPTTFQFQLVQHALT